MMGRSVVLVLALLVCDRVIADGQAFLIQCEISNRGQIVGSPTLLAHSGQEAKVAVSGTYTLSVFAEPSDSGQVRFSADLEINGESYSPTMLLDLDKEANLQMGDIGFAITISGHAADDS